MSPKRFVLVVFIIAALVLRVPAADAKGPVDRAIISGPGFAEDLILTDRDALREISMASLEQFEDGAIEEPAGLGEGYTLERQFQTSPGHYSSFDRVVYYPDPGGDLGYIFYEGIVNGSSDYDGHWFRARPSGDAAMRMIITGTLPRPYLLLANNSGEFHLLDPETLDEIAAVHVVDDWGYLQDVATNGVGTTLYYSHNPGPYTAQYRLDLAAQTNCRIDDQPDFWLETLDGRTYRHAPGSSRIDVYDPHASIQNTSLPLPAPDTQLSASPGKEWIFGVTPRDGGLFLTSILLFLEGNTMESLRYDTNAFADPAQLRATWDVSNPVPTFYLTDGLAALSMPFMDNESITEKTLDYEGRAAVEAGIARVEILAANEGQLYLYHPLGTSWIYDTDAVERGDIQRGIFVIDTGTGRQTAHWLPDLEITQGAYSHDHLYVISAPPEAESVQLLQLDITSGEIVNTKTLPADSWAATYVRLNPDAVQALGESLSACPDPEPPLPEPVAGPSPVTATPAP